VGLRVADDVMLLMKTVSVVICEVVVTRIILVRLSFTNM